LPVPTQPQPQGLPDFAIPTLSARMAVRNFVQVVDTVEPVAEQICRARAPSLNCDFLIVVEDDPRAGINAFQTLDDTGRPVIAFTVPINSLGRTLQMRIACQRSGRLPRAFNGA